MTFLGGWFTIHHMCRWVEVKEEKETMKVEVIIIVDLGQSLLIR